MPHVITITGPSGAGKSTTLRYLLGCADDSFRPEMVPKYTTRSQHTDDRGEVLCVESIPIQCNLVYEQYGVRYGLKLKDIFDLIAERKSPVVILNDVRAVEDVRNALGGLVRSMFVFRESPTPERFLKLAQTKGLYKKKELLFSVEWHLQSDLKDCDLSPGFRQKFQDHRVSLSDDIVIALGEKDSLWLISDVSAEQTYIVERTGETLNVHEGIIDEDELELRLQKAQALYRIYIENIYLFDHVIVNSGTFDDLKRQVKQIARGLSQNRNWPLCKKEAV